MAKNKDNIGTDLELFRDLINKSNDAIFVADPPTGLFIFVNDKACETLGYDRRELLGMGVMDIETELPDNFSWQAHLDELRQKGSLIFEGIHKRKNGATFPVEANISYVVLNTREYLVTVVRDITERKRTEGAMRLQSEIAANISEGIYLVSANDLRIVYANPRMEEIFGYDTGEMNGKHVSIINAPSGGDPQKTASQIEKALKETGRWRGEVYNVRKDGTPFWGHVSISMLHHPDYGEIYVSLQSDITEHKRAEAALSASEGRFRHLFEDSPVSLWEEDISELQTHIAALRSAGITDLGAYFAEHPEEVFKCVGLVKVISVNKTTLDLYEASDQAMLLHDLSRVFTAGSFDAFKGILIALSTGVQMYECETVNQTLSGRTIDILLRWSLISSYEAGRARALISAVDITQRKRAEEDLLKTQKLESLGILAGGIAHDFNNILTAILGNISLARMKMKPGEPQFKRLEEAERASYHAKELTQQLLTFAKGGAPVKSTVSLEQLIRDSVGFAIRGSNVRCDFSFSEGLWPVDVDEGQMGQVFNNLVINACQAMPGGGIITIDAQNVAIGSKDGMPLPEERYVKVSIEDQGTGISEEHLQRIFDPYFTTKQMGSGLGLSIVHSVIRNHNGNITVKSQLGAGTTFIIYLPASTAMVVGKAIQGEDYILGKGRVLLMDDEEIVRNVAGEILKETGYEVEFASDGAEAIMLYKTALASSRPFDAVIMDLTVPGGMGGEEATQKLREIDPEVKAVVSSGYSQDPIMANYREYGFCEVIAKPFSGVELGRIMHKVIVKL